MKRSLLFALVLSICGLTYHSAFAQCVEVAFFDDAGQLIVSEGLVVGMMVGGAPVFNVAVPVHRESKTVRTVKCPKDLTQEVNRLYNRSCVSERARQQTVETNGVSIDVVLQRCTDLSVALNVGK